MAVPLSYNLRSLKVRWTSTVVAILGIAGIVDHELRVKLAVAQMALV